MRSQSSAPDIELWTYRTLCLLGAVSLPLTAIVFERVEPTWVDPLWLRLLLAALPLGLLLASFMSEQVRRELGSLTTVLLYVLVAWFAAISFINDLPAEYALAAMVLVVAVGVVSGAGDRRLWTLGAALVTVTLAVILVALASAQPGVDRAIFIGAVIAVSATLYASTWMRRRLRRQLRASEDRYRTVFERVADGVALADADSLRVVASNEAYRQITGFPRQIITTRTLYDFLTLRADQLDVHVRRTLQDDSVDLGECHHLRYDGSEVLVEIGMSRVPDEDGDLLCLTLRDLTDVNRVRAQIQLARDQAQTMLELRTAFLNNMSHEIRTPLVSLTGFLSIMEEDPDGIDPAERKEMLGSLRRSADRLNETLNAVLDLAQMEGGQYRLDLEPVEIVSTAEEAVAEVHDAARAKGLGIELQFTEPARILADRGALRRILVNILSNAVKFTASGMVTIAGEADSHRVVLHVRDTGVGIEPAFLPDLFSAFRQGSTGLAREHEGCGLGLTIAKRLLDLMGGRIRVESEPGEGTRITLAFARTWATTSETFASTRFDSDAGSDGGSAPATPAWDAAADIEPLAPRPRALIVEDNADTARLMKRMLGDAFDANVAADADAALERARSAWYDIVLVDVHLGAGMDGATLLGRLRAMSAYAHVPAVAVTTQRDGAMAAQLTSAGFDTCLAKPFTRAQLLKATEQAYAARMAAIS